MDLFIVKFKNSKFLKVIDTKRGIKNNHKFVLLCNNKITATNLLMFLSEHNICSSNGYILLSKEKYNLINSIKIDKRVIEIPIEDDSEKMNYIFDTIEKFNDKNIK